MLICLRIGRLYREIQTDWINGLSTAAWCSVRSSVRSCTWVSTMPCKTPDLRKSSLRTAQQKGAWCCWLAAACTWVCSVPMWPGEPVILWLVSRRVWPAGWGKWLSLCFALVRPHVESTVFSFGLFNSKRTVRCWYKANESGEGAVARVLREVAERTGC